MCGSREATSRFGNEKGKNAKTTPFLFQIRLFAHQSFVTISYLVQSDAGDLGKLYRAFQRRFPVIYSLVLLIIINGDSFLHFHPQILYS